MLSTPIPWSGNGLDPYPHQSQDRVALGEWNDLDFLWKLAHIACLDQAS